MPPPPGLLSPVLAAGLIPLNVFPGAFPNAYKTWEGVHVVLLHKCLFLTHPLPQKKKKIKNCPSIY